MSKSSSRFKFEITSDWFPKKGSPDLSFVEAVVKTALTLVSGESFPVSMTDLKKFGGYSSGNSAASSLRCSIRKRVGKNKIGEYGLHIIKDASDKEVAIRIRKK